MKRLFIDRHYKDGERAEEYSFIQAKVYDNRALMAKQPDYVRQLEALPAKQRAAWLDGSWDIYDGAFFDDFRTEPDIKAAAEAGCTLTAEELREQRRWVHVIPAFDLSAGASRGWNILRSYGIPLRIPGILSCCRIPWMPTQGYDTATLMLSQNLLSHTVERNAVEIFLAVEFYLTEVESHHCRIVARSEEHVALSFIPFPGGTIHRVILMAQHDTLV